MNHPHFSSRFAGGALVAGALLSLAGWFARPVVIDKSFTVESLGGVAASPDLWVLSFRLLVFGLFVRLAGLVSLATFARPDGPRAVVVPGVVISAAGLLVSAMGQGYYMDIAIHGVWRFQQVTDAAAREAILATWLPTDEWVSCLGRMGLMFLGLGSVVLGVGLRGEAPGWATWLVGGVGFAAMMGIFAAPGNRPVEVAAFVGLAVVHGVLGVTTARAGARRASQA